MKLKGLYDEPAWNKRPRRLPLRSIKELAEEFGTTPLLLSRHLQASELKPKLVMRNVTVKNTWYEPGPVRAWWKTRLANLKVENENPNEQSPQHK